MMIVTEMNEILYQLIEEIECQRSSTVGPINY